MFWEVPKIPEIGEGRGLKTESVSLIQDVL